MVVVVVVAGDDSVKRQLFRMYRTASQPFMTGMSRKERD